MKTLFTSLVLALTLIPTVGFAAEGDETCIRWQTEAAINDNRTLMGMEPDEAARQGWSCGHWGHNRRTGQRMGQNCNKLETKTCIYLTKSPAARQAQLVGQSVSAHLQSGAKAAIDTNMDSMRKEITTLQAEVARLVEALNRNHEAGNSLRINNR